MHGRVQQRVIGNDLFLEQICNYFSTNAIPLEMFVTNGGGGGRPSSSRPEDIISDIITPLKPSSPSEWSVVHIHDIEGSLLVQADIKVYVEDELADIARFGDWEVVGRRV